MTSKKSTSSRADSLANHLATRDEGRAREMTATSGLKCLELYEKSSPLTSWQRMFLASLLGTKAFFSRLSTLTWRLNSTKLPRRLYFRLLPSVPHIEGIGSGFVPTPDSTTGAPNKNSNKKRGPKALIDYARSPEKLWPTPTANRRVGLQSHGKNAILGQLNPTWVEWLMGFPLGWTDLEDSETPSSPK